MTGPTAPAPPRPDPYATTAPLEGLRDNGTAKIVCLSPSVNLTPMGNAMVSVPYMVTDTADHKSNYSTTVNFTSQKVLTLRSFTQHCHGDEAGIGGGVKSGTHGGICEPISHAPAVKVQGSPVIRHGDTFYMNNRNTTGQAYYVKDKSTYPAPADTDPLPGSVKMRPGLAFSGGAVGLLETPATKALLAPPPLAPAPPPLLEPVPTLPPLTPELPPPAALVEGFGEWAARLAAPVAAAAIILFTPTSTSYLDDFVPHDEWEAQLLQHAYGYMKQGYSGDAVRSYVATNLKKHRAEKQVQVQRAPQPLPAPGSGNVRVSEEDERKKRCRVGPYSEMAPICNARGEQAHHIMPDYALRYGNRTQGIAGQNRIPAMPSFQGGMSICMSGNARQPRANGDESADASERTHWTAHQADNEIEEEGDENSPVGTLPIGRIKIIAAKWAILARKECAPEITGALSSQFPPSMDKVLGRSTQSKPQGDALTALSHGATETNWQTFIQPKP